ncbi:alpha/beta hydrolase [Amycolatopsis sp. H20-H5]|uniref:alpha/beta hydrolase n=1 Tax=Amycolatopsis sp. H20-H5 TaxID=3046309 RepID=UPI002DBCAF7E|nr:alpha/beta hydrolase [Amycolatopsis sp. H20-H5]MEC3975760.1 alpha/beta hydrolase [Amycolatopsis sp. H20-H5]
MPVDPQMQIIIDLLESSGAGELAKGSPQDVRGFLRISAGADPSNTVQVGSVDDQDIAGPAGPLTVRIYRPETTGPAPTVVFFHGGGMVAGDLDSHDDHGRMICRDVGAVVVSVAYRLAPEHPFPAAFDDCLAATRWAVDAIATLGGDPDRLAVAGDSAGGNLAAAVAIAARTDGPQLAAQLLVYPKTDFTEDTAYQSRIDNAEGYFLTGELADWFQGHYISPDDIRDPRASVLLAEDLSGVAPAVIGVGEYDLLRDEVTAYGKRLEGAGVAAVVHCFDGLIHGFYGMGLMSDAAADAVRTLNADLRRLLDAAVS